MSALLFPLVVAHELLSATVFLNLGTQTEGFAATALAAFAPAQAVAVRT